MNILLKGERGSESTEISINYTDDSGNLTGPG